MEVSEDALGAAAAVGGSTGGGGGTLAGSENTGFGGVTTCGAEGFVGSVVKLSLKCVFKGKEEDSFVCKLMFSCSIFFGKLASLWKNDGGLPPLAVTLPLPLPLPLLGVVE